MNNEKLIVMTEYKQMVDIIMEEWNRYPLSQTVGSRRDRKEKSPKSLIRNEHHR